MQLSPPVEVRGARAGRSRRLRAGLVLAAALALASRSASAFPTFRSATTPLNGDATSDEGEDTTPRIATDGAGTWLAVWGTTNPPGSAFDPDIVFARSSDGGATWTAPAILDFVAP